MSERTLRRILLGVALLAVAYAGVALFRSGPGTVTPGEGEAGGGGEGLAAVLGELDPSRVEQVVVERRDREPVVLARSGDRWTVNGLRADSGRIARLWRSLGEVDPGAPVVRNPDNHPRLGVAPESADRLTLVTSDGTEHVLLVGDRGPVEPSVYVRLAGRDEVHLLGSGLGHSVDQGVATWRDHTIVAVDTSRVRVLESVSGTDAYTLRREGGGWTIDGEPAAERQARNLVGGLRRVLAADFLDGGGAAPGAGDQAEGAGPPRPDRRLVALDAQGDTLADLAFREMSNDGFSVRSRGDDTLYEIAPFDVVRLFPSRNILTRGDETDETSQTDDT